METFIDLNKITNGENVLKSNEVLRELKSLSFIKIRAVNDKDLPKFLKELEVLNTKLDDAIVNLYRNGTGA